MHLYLVCRRVLVIAFDIDTFDSFLKSIQEVFKYKMPAREYNGYTFKIMNALLVSFAKSASN